MNAYVISDCYEADKLYLVVFAETVEDIESVVYETKAEFEGEYTLDDLCEKLTEQGYDWIEVTGTIDF